MIKNPLSRKNDMLWRKLKVPATLFLELTPRCTLDCRMCYVHLTPEQMGDRRELTTEEWIRIIDEALPLGTFRVVLTGGESMLHEGFWEIYSHLRENGVLVSVNTNGLLLTDEAIARFRASPPASLRITLYGADDDGYERCTGHRAFTPIVCNIKKLVAAGIKPQLTVTVSRYNQDQFLEILQVARDLGLPIRYAMDLIEAEEGTQRSHETFALSAQETAVQMERLLESLHLPKRDNPPLDWAPRRLPSDPGVKGLVCAAGKSHYVVRWDGRAAACFDIDTDVYVQRVGLAAALEAVKEMAAQYPYPVECIQCPLHAVCAPCVLFRADPKDPGHCNLEVCRKTQLLYNAGLISLPKPDGEAPLQTSSEDAVCPG